MNHLLDQKHTVQALDHRQEHPLFQSMPYFVFGSSRKQADCNPLDGNEFQAVLLSCLKELKLLRPRSVAHL